MIEDGWSESAFGVKKGLIKIGAAKVGIGEGGATITPAEGGAGKIGIGEIRVGKSEFNRENCGSIEISVTKVGFLACSRLKVC